MRRAAERDSIAAAHPPADTLQILPDVFGPKQAAAFGTLVEPDSGNPSDLCARTALRRVISAAAAKGLGFTVGVEVRSTARG